MKRPSHLAADADRCHMSVRLRGPFGTDRCKRRATVGLFCKQHSDRAWSQGFRQGEHGFELESKPTEAGK